MKSFAEKIYQSSPAYLQNILISLYGYKLYHNRYRGEIASRVRNDILTEKQRSTKDRIAFQSERMNEMIKYCRLSIPYYQALFANYGYSEQNFTSLNDIKKLPILEKITLIENRDLFRPLRNTKFTTQVTSGSTGTPLALDVDEYTYKLAMALVVEHEENHGIAFNAPRVTLAGRLIQPLDNQNPPFWRFNKAENQYLFSSYHLNEVTFPSYRNDLDKIKPHEIIGYPSAIADLATHYKETDTRPNFTVKAIITNSESLLYWQKERIKDVFGCPVYDYYGTAEYVAFAAQRSDGNYKASSLLGILELVPLEAQSSEYAVIASTLCNTAMPLLRYNLGDTATINKELSAKNELIIANFNGRKDDYIVTPNGRKIGRIDHIFKDITGIKEAQVIQQSIRRVVIKAVKQNNDYFNETQLKKNFIERVGTGIELEVEIVTTIPRGKNGKFKSVIGMP